MPTLLKATPAEPKWLRIIGFKLSSPLSCRAHTRRLIRSRTRNPPRLLAYRVCRCSQESNQPVRSANPPVDPFCRTPLCRPPTSSPPSVDPLSTPFCRPTPLWRPSSTDLPSVDPLATLPHVDNPSVDAPSVYPSLSSPLC